MKTGSAGKKKEKRRKKIGKPHATEEKVEKRGGPLKLIYVYNGIREK